MRFKLQWEMQLHIFLGIADEFYYHCTHKGEPQRQLSIPPSLVALSEAKALASNYFYLLRFFKRIRERNKDTSFHTVSFNLW